MLQLLTIGCSAAATVGLVQAVAGTTLLHRFRRSAPVAGSLPPMTVLKPLYGTEPLLEEALASFCRQDYPAVQIVFGLASATDPALGVVDRLRERFPDCDIATIVDATRHGSNGKVGNLINMLRAARHDLLVIADSDIHAAPDTLRHVAAALAQPGAGLATALYTGLPATGTLPGQLGAAFINHSFLPGALLARALGRQDCFGAIMALRRSTLAEIGGFEALANHVADDARLGRLVTGRKLEIALVASLPATTVPERTFADLLSHELRWARTTRSVAPAGFAAGVLQYPLFWAMLAVAFGADSLWPWLGAGVVWIARFGLVRASERTLGVPGRLPFWLLPVRDLLSVAVMLASYRSKRVAWRGQEHTVEAFSQPAFEPGRG